MWATVGAIAVLALELLGSASGVAGLGALGALVLVMLALTRLLPPGSLTGRPGLPAVIATRGLMSAGFFCAEAYIVYVLQEQWGLTPGRAGIALSVVGVTWALSSQAQARLGERVSHVRAMEIGSLLVLAGVLSLALTVWLDGPAFLAGATYVLAGAGMGFGYPRTSVAMLDVSTDADRGFNSAALSIADSLGAALALSISGVVFAAAAATGRQPVPRGVRLRHRSRPARRRHLAPDGTRPYVTRRTSTSNGPRRYVCRSQSATPIVRSHVAGREECGRRNREVVGEPEQRGRERHRPHHRLAQVAGHRPLADCLERGHDAAPSVPMRSATSAMRAA